jgi:hypothetical protein
MKIVELFAGSRSFSKIAEARGHEVFTTDYKAFEGIDLVADFLDVKASDIPFKPDIIWASPPCTGFSVAAIGHHWTGGVGAYIPRTDTAKNGIKLLDHTLKIINELQPTYWFIENPRGLMRKMPQVESLNRNTVTYCQYGDTRMKPTDIWTNSTNWIPRKMCKNGSPCHEAAPRGSSTGTQGLKNNYERSKVPHELCLEILKSCEQ